MKKRMTSLLLSVSMLLSTLPTYAFADTAATATAVTASSDIDAQSITTITTEVAQALGFNTTIPEELAADPYGLVAGGGISMLSFNELYVDGAQNNNPLGYLYNWDRTNNPADNSLLNTANRTSYDADALTDGLGDYSNNYSMRTVAFDPLGSGQDSYIARHRLSYGGSDHALEIVDATTGNIVATLDLGNIPLTGGNFEQWEIGAFMAITAGDFDGDGRDEIALYDASVYTTGATKQGEVKIYEVDVTYDSTTNETNLQGSISQITYIPLVDYGDSTLVDDDGKFTAEEMLSVSLTAGPLYGNANEDLIITVNYNNQTAADAGKIGSRVLVYENVCEVESDKRIDHAPTEVLGQFDDIYDDLGTGVINREIPVSLRNAATVLVNADNSGNLRLAIGGEGNNDDEAGFTEDLFCNLYLTMYELQNGALVPVGGKVTWNKGLGVTSASYRGNAVFEPVAMVAYAADGMSDIDSIFLDGSIFKDNDDKDSRDGYYGEVDYAFDLNGIEHVEMPKLSFPYDGKKDMRWVDQAVAANLTNNYEGVETVVFSYSSKENNSANRSVGIATFTSDKVVFTGDGLLNTSIFYQFTHNYTATQIYDVGSYACVSLSTPDVDGDSVLMQSSGKEAEYFFSDPTVVAVLQAAPRFSEIDTHQDLYSTLGSTSIAESSGITNSESQSINVRGSAYTSYTLGLGEGNGITTKFGSAMTYGGTWSESTSRTTTVTYSSNSADDRVVVSMIPYIRYYYNMYVPSYVMVSEAEYQAALEEREDKYAELATCTTEYGTESDEYAALAEEIVDLEFWIDDVEKSLAAGYDFEETVPEYTQPCEVNIPDEVQVEFMLLDDYDDTMAQFGWTSLRDTVFPEGYTVGDPATYAYASGLYDDWKAASTSANSLGHSSETVTQTLAISDSDGFTNSLGIAFDLAVDAKVQWVGIGGAFSLGYTGGWGTVTNTGTTYAGAVKGTSDKINGEDMAGKYDFNWEFGTYYVPYDYDGAGVRAEYDCLVLAYMVDDVEAPPSAPVQLSVSNIDTNSLTLNWVHGTRAADTYTIYRYNAAAAAQYTPVATVSGDTNTYDVTGLLAAHTYTYVIQAESEGDTSVYSAPVTATTLPEDCALDITVEFADGYEDTYNIGESVTMQATVTSTNASTGSTPAYQWQQLEGNSWENIGGAVKDTYTYGALLAIDFGNQYRCVVSQEMGDGEVFVNAYSNVLTIEQDETVDTVTILSIAPDSGYADTKTYDVGSESIAYEDAEVTAVADGVTYRVYDMDGTYYLYALIADADDTVQTVLYQATTGDADLIDAMLTAKTSAEVTLTGTYSSADSLSMEKVQYLQTDTDYICTVEALTAAEQADNGTDNGAITVGDTTYPTSTSYTVVGVNNTEVTIVEAIGTTTTDADTGESITPVAYFLQSGDTYTALTQASYYVVGESTISATNVTWLTTDYTATQTTISEGESVDGTEVTLTATVKEDSKESDGAYTDYNGTVTFAITNQSTGQVIARVTATAENGIATATWTAPAAGEYTITATAGATDTAKPSSSNSTTYTAIYRNDTSTLGIAGEKDRVYGDADNTYYFGLYDSVTNGEISFKVFEGATTYSGTYTNLSDATDTGSLTLTTAGVNDGYGTFTFTPNKSGTYRLSLTVEDDGDTYTTTSYITVEKAEMTVTAGDKTRTSSENAVATYITPSTSDYTVAGLLHDDSLSNNLLMIRYNTSQSVGEYPITLSWADVGATDTKAITDCYNVTFVDGVYSVMGDTHTLTLNIEGAGSIYAVSGGKAITSPATITDGNSVIITAYPDEGYETTWTNVSGSEGNPYSSDPNKFDIVHVTENTVVNITFTQPSERNVTYAVNDAAYGEISATSTVDGVESAYTSGTEIAEDAEGTLLFTATPAENCTIASWTVNGILVCAADGTSNHTQSTYQLDTADLGDGTTAVQVQFASIAPDDPATDATLNVTVQNSAGTVLPVDFTLQAVGATDTVSATAGTATYTGVIHDNVTIALAQDTAVTVNDWGGAYAVDAITATVFDLPAGTTDVILTATPTATYTVSYRVLPDEGGTVTAAIGTEALTSGNSYSQGSKVVYTIAETITDLQSFAVNGKDVTDSLTDNNDGTYTYTAYLMADTTAVATFADQPTVTIHQPTGAEIAVANGQSAVQTGDAVAPNTELTITATPESNYALTSILVDGLAVEAAQSGDALTYTVTIGADDVTITAVAKLLPAISLGTSVQDCDVTVTVDGDTQTITGDAVAYVPEGSDVTLTVTPAEGEIVSTILGNPVTADDYAYTLENVTANVTVEATFLSLPVITFSQPSTGGAVVVTDANGEAITSGDTVPFGTALTVTLVPDSGYQVVKVEGATYEPTDFALQDGTSWSHEIDGNQIYSDFAIDWEDYAAFEEIPSVELTYAVNGSNGEISATVNNDSIDSGATLYGGEIVTLVATPASEFEVDTWTVLDDVSYTEVGEVLVLTISSDLTDASNIDVQVSFAETSDASDETYTIAYSLAGETEQAEIAAVNDTDSTSNGTITANEDDTVTFTATVDSGYQVAYWVDSTTGFVDSKDATYTHTASGNATITAYIARESYTVAFSGDNGTVSANALASGTSVQGDTEVLFVATPSLGYAFAGWQVEGMDNYTATDNMLTLTVTEDVEVTATFTAQTHTITYQVHEDGMGDIAADGESVSSSDGEITVTTDSTIDFTATPASGYAIYSWIVDGTTYTNNSAQFSLANIKNSHTVVAVLTEAPVTDVDITLLTSGYGTLSATVNGQTTTVRDGQQTITVQSTDSVALALAPDLYNTVDKFLVGGTARAGTSYTLINPDADQYVIASFVAEDTYTLTTSVSGGNGSLQVQYGYGDDLTTATSASSNTIVKGMRVVVTALPNSGYTLASWTANGEAQTGNQSNTYTMAAMTENLLLTATMEALTLYAIPNEDGSITKDDVKVATITNVTKTPADVGDDTHVRAGGTVTFDVWLETGYYVRDAGYTADAVVSYSINSDGSYHFVYQDVQGDIDADLIDILLLETLPIDWDTLTPDEREVVEQTQADFEELTQPYVVQLQQQNEGSTVSDMELHEMTLWIWDKDTETMVEATLDNFPTGGVTIYLPYPDGITYETAQDMSFVITHQFSEGGMTYSESLDTFVVAQAGDTEVFSTTYTATDPRTITLTANGLGVTVYGMSFFGVVGITPPVVEDTDTDDDYNRSPSRTETQYDVTITVEGEGTISPNGGDDATLSVTRGSDKTFKVLSGTLEDVLVDGDAIDFTATRFTVEDIQDDIALTVIFTGEAQAADVSPFLDLATTDPAFAAVVALYDLGIINGMTEVTFGGNVGINRGMITTMLHRVEGEPAVTAANTFADVVDGMWYTDGIVWAAAQGVVNGYTDGTFCPLQEITNQEMCVILMQYAQSKGVTVDATQTVAGVADWAAPAVAWALEHDLLDTTAVATAVVTRAQACQMIYSLLQMG